MRHNVSQRIFAMAEEHETALCCGLDPIPELLVEHSVDPGDADMMVRFLCSVVEVTSDLVCAYKLQKAFFDSLPGGHSVLRRVVQHIRIEQPGLPVILDCKAGDVGHTMQAYYSYAFDYVGVDSLMVNPLLGSCVWKGLDAWPGTSACVLVRTSNPEASEFQDFVGFEGEPFWAHVARAVVAGRAKLDLIPVFSQSERVACETIRSLVSDETPILFAGFGAQGVDLAGLSALANSSGGGVFANSSRGILFDRREGEDWPQGSIRQRAQEARAVLNRAFVNG